MSFGEILLTLAEGFGTTVLLFVLTLVLALPLGLLVAFCSMSKIAPIKWLSRSFVWVIRGTPLMLQIIVLFYGPGLVFDYPMSSRMLAVTAAFVINYACYFSEIYRGGIESIAKGQQEAGQVLGMTRAQIFFKVVLFQVFKRILPPLSNEVITLVKDTSLARIVSVGEIIKSSQDIMKATASIMPLFYAGVFYLVFNGLLTVLFARMEKKLNYYKG